MNIHILQHVPFEGPAGIEDWALSDGHTVSFTRFYAQDHFPALDRFDLLVVMGGPMSVHDEHMYSWLKGEKWFIRQVIEAGKPVLGICLGAQLIADVLGARVYQSNHKEMGWLPVQLDSSFRKHILGESLPSQITVFHWHGETFDIPVGAQRIATSVGCDNQGFIYQDRVIGLQFHTETTPVSAESMVEYCGEELEDGPYVQSAEKIVSAQEFYPELTKYLAQIMDYLKGNSG